MEAFLQFGAEYCERLLITTMKFTVCPFCGVVSEGAHDSQEACIRALQDEIQRTREILTQSRTARTVPVAEPEDDEEPQPS